MKEMFEVKAYPYIFNIQDKMLTYIFDVNKEELNEIKSNIGETNGENC